MKLLNIIFVALLVISVTGCATERFNSKAGHRPSPLSAKLKAFRAPVSLAIDSTQTTLAAKPPGSLTLDQALALALRQHPELKAFSLEVRALEARQLQAGLAPNPELDLEGGNFAGTGESGGFDGIESSVQLSQLIELGGKRSKRMQVAQLEKYLAEWDYETKRLDIITEVTLAFINVLAAQERLALSGEIVALAKQVRNTVSERIMAGKVSPVEGIKAAVALSTSEIELERFKRKLESSKQVLAATWGKATADFSKVVGVLGAVAALPSQKQLTDLLENNPDIARWAMELEKQQAQLEYEKAVGRPDLTLSGGIEHANEIRGIAFVVGVSIPLQFHDRNQGAIQAADYRMDKTAEEQRAAEIGIRTALAESYQTLSSNYYEANAWKSKVLPGAKSAFEAVNEGYRQGKFGLLDVLDAQRTLFEAKSQYVETLAEYHKGVAYVERLIATPLHTIK